LLFLLQISKVPYSPIAGHESPRAGVSVWFLLGVGWSGLASRLINEPAVVAKPVSISPDNCWLSLAKSHFSNKSIAPTGSGAEQYQLINAVDKRHACANQTEGPPPPRTPERRSISIHCESVFLRPGWTFVVTFANG